MHHLTSLPSSSADLQRHVCSGGLEGPHLSLRLVPNLPPLPPRQSAARSGSMLIWALMGALSVGHYSLQYFLCNSPCWSIAEDVDRMEKVYLFHGGTEETSQQAFILWQLYFSEKWQVKCLHILLTYCLVYSFFCHPGNIGSWDFFPCLEARVQTWALLCALSSLLFLSLLIRGWNWGKWWRNRVICHVYPITVIWAKDDILHVLMKHIIPNSSSFLLRVSVGLFNSFITTNVIFSI